MAATALIKFTQLPSVPLAGVALSGISGVQVDIENGSATDILSWKVDLVYVPPGSAVPTGTLAMGNSNMPFASFTPDLVPGSYRVVLTVYAGINQTGQSNVDIRCFVVPDANGIVFPPYQDLPSKLPVVGSGLAGEKPDELNLNSQPYGWDGDGTDGLLLDFLRQASAQLGGGGGAAGWNQVDVVGAGPHVVAMGDMVFSGPPDVLRVVSLPQITAANVGQSVMLINVFGGLGTELVATIDGNPDQLAIVSTNPGPTYTVDQIAQVAVLTAVDANAFAPGYVWVLESVANEVTVLAGTASPHLSVFANPGTLYVERSNATSTLWVNTSVGYSDTWTDLAGGGGYTDEQAQDAIGAMLLNTTTVNLTYVDGTPSLAADVNNASLGVVKLANGTAGQLITWSAGGAAAVVPTGNLGQVLTSGGLGVAPTFQAAPGAVESVVTPAAIAVDTANYAPVNQATWSAATHARISASVTALSISGFAAVTPGGPTTKRIINVGTTHAITLLNEGGASLAANRMLLPGGLSYVLNIGATVDLWYDPTSLRWRLVSDSEGEVWEHAQAMSDYDGTDLTTGKKAYYRVKRPILLRDVFITINSDFLPTGTALTVDVRRGVGDVATTTLLSTLLSIDASESSSHTAATPYAFTGGGNPILLNAGDRLEFYVIAIPGGTNTRGLIVTLIGIPV